VAGSNDFGQCNVQGWRNYIAVRAGMSNTVGLKADGTVVVCGDNKFGQCNTQNWRNIGLNPD
jgi:alpha-tubulin suppressor-like RCC1 family protein